MHQARFVDALLGMNRVAAEEILTEALEQCSLDEVVTSVVVPALERIGDDWVRGELSLSDVYMSSRICEELISSLASRTRSPRRRSRQPRIAIAALLDYHLLGKKMVQLVLRSSGYDVLDFGQGISVEDLVDRVRAEHVEVLLISTLMLPSALKVKDVRRKLEEAGLRPKIVVGGAPFRFDDSLWKEVGADVMGVSASDALKILDAIVTEERAPQATMSSLERVLTTLDQREPDRVPVFLLLTMHGAKELGLSIREYFSKAEYVVEGQLRMRAKFQHDCVFPFFYAAAEVEAWGSDVIYVEDGPPNTGRPLLRTPEDILQLSPPRIDEAPSLLKTLKAEEMLKARLGNEVPILGTVMSPFSLPVMQMGFDRYVELIYERPELFERLMRVNEEFCVAWANAQLRAGATAVTYYDPVSSTTIISPEMYLRTGFTIAKRTIARIEGLTATHMASGLCLPILDAIGDTGTKAIGVSVDEDMGEIKRASGRRLTVIGNLNGIEMRHWNTQQCNDAVKRAIASAGPGGGFILCDNHGEIPFQVPESVLFDICEAARRWGRYPLDWPGE